jgi:hypothetical protein
MTNDSDVRACIDKSWEAGRQSMLNDICEYLNKYHRGFIFTWFDIQRIKEHFGNE